MFFYYCLSVSSICIVKSKPKVTIEADSLVAVMGATIQFRAVLIDEDRGDSEYRYTWRDNAIKTHRHVSDPFISIPETTY